eukprot:336002_1
MASNNKIKKVSQQIIKDAKNLQHLPQLIKLFKQNGSSTTTNGILWLERIFIHYNEKISFLSDDNADNKAAQWMSKQYLSFESILLHLFDSSNIISTIQDSFKTLLHFAEIQNKDALFDQILLIFLFKQSLTNELKSILTAFIFDAQHRCNAIKSFTKLCHLSPPQLLAQYYSFTKKRHSTKSNDEPSKLQSIFSWNTLHILLMFSEESLTHPSGIPSPKKRKFNNTTNTANDVIRNKNNYLNIAWLHYLGSKHLEIKIYHLILTKLESHIFKVFKQSSTNNGKYSGSDLRSNKNNVILLSDFLTDSYNIGGEISLLSLKGLFTLIHQYNLDYPQFYEKLYQKLHSNIFFSKNATAFFELLQLFLLKSDYLPSYLVAAFIKRLSRMSLVAPPHAIIFIVNIIMDLLRKYPAVRFLVDQSKKSNEGLMEAMKVHKQQKLMNVDHEEEEDQDVGDVDGDCDDDEWIGKDPFDFECMDPKLCRANESSLWELKSLINHFEYKTSGHCFQTVTHFRDNEYKRVEMNKCHMFQYHKLLNYYFIKNEWFTRNLNNEKKRAREGRYYNKKDDKKK